MMNEWLFHFSWMSTYMYILEVYFIIFFSIQNCCLVYIYLVLVFVRQYICVYMNMSLNTKLDYDTLTSVISGEKSVSSDPNIKSGDSSGQCLSNTTSPVINNKYKI